jgi:hypothetical protein
MSSFYPSMTQQPESTAPGGSLKDSMFDNTVSTDARSLVEDAIDRAAIAPEDADRTSRVLTRELNALGIDATTHRGFLDAASRSAAPEGVEADLAAGRTARALHNAFGAGAALQLQAAVEWAQTRAPGIAASLAGSAALVDPAHAVELVRAYKRAQGRA